MSVCAALLPALGRSLRAADFATIWYSHDTSWSEPHVFTELPTVCNPFRNTQCAAQYAAVKLSVDGSVFPTEQSAFLFTELPPVCCPFMSTD